MLNYMIKKRNQKGFTLMEMLIVVAIIAILIAIAVPVFSTQLNKAKAATDNANTRSLKAIVAAKYLTEEDIEGTYYFDGPQATDAVTTEGGIALESDDGYVNVTITDGEITTPTYDENGLVTAGD